MPPDGAGAPRAKGGRGSPPWFVPGRRKPPPAPRESCRSHASHRQRSSHVRCVEDRATGPWASSENTTELYLPQRSASLLRRPPQRSRNRGRAGSRPQGQRARRVSPRSGSIMGLDGMSRAAPGSRVPRHRGCATRRFRCRAGDDRGSGQVLQRPRSRRVVPSAGSRAAARGSTSLEAA